MFHMPMSSPQRIRMLGFFVAIAVTPPFQKTCAQEKAAHIPRRAVTRRQAARQPGIGRIQGGIATQETAGSPNPVTSCLVNECDQAGVSIVYAVTVPSGHSRMTRSTRYSST